MPAVERGKEWHWMLRLKADSEPFIDAIELCLGSTAIGILDGSALAVEAIH